MLRTRRRGSRSGTGRTVVGDPGGIWIDGRTRLLEDLYTGEEKKFEFVPGPDMLGNLDANDWDRFKTNRADLDPNQSDGGLGLYWLEYGDPSPTGERMLVAVWASNRAASRLDHRTGVHIFFDPRTDLDFYAPADVFPY